MICKRILILIVFFSIPHFLQAQDFNLIGAGARARSMAGAYIGIADDITATFWNPGGLTQQNKKYEVIFTGDCVNYGLSRKIQEPLFNYLGVSYRIYEKLVVALSSHRIMNYHSKYKVENEFSKKREFGVCAYSPSIAYKLSKWSFGLAFNILWGNLDFTYDSKSVDNYGEDVDENYKYSGSELTVGILHGTNDQKFRVGGVVRVPICLKEQEKKIGYETRIKMPWMVGLGYSFSLFESLILSGDVEWRDYSTLKRIYKKKFDHYNKEEEETIGDKDICQVRLGTEYTFNCKNPKISIRMGVATTPSMYQDLNNDRIIGSLISLGVGITIKEWLGFDLGFEYNNYSFDYEHIEYREIYRRYFFSTSFRFDKFFKF